MRSLVRGLTVAFACVAITASLHAQVVRGSVVARDSTPVGGVIVVATGAGGGPAVRALTTPQGDFTLRLPAGGRYELKVLRIGYRPSPGPAVTVAEGATETVRLVFTGETVTLSAVNVRDRETCRVNADTGLMVTRVWEEARKAMLSSQLSTEGAPLFAEWIEYDRSLDSTSRLVRQQRVRTSRNPTTHAFRSRSAAFLDSAGYVIADNTGTTYFAPDAEVLLSDVFAAGHCFRLQPAPAGNSGLIGVSFQPARDRREIREIQGTLWLDRTSAELRTLEFRFTNLNDVAEAAGAGGRVEFLRLAEGSWLISRWNLRMPQLEAARNADNGLRRTIMSTRPILRAVQVTGGEVTRVTRHDSLVYAAQGPRVALQVIARDTLVGAAGAVVKLDGTDYAGTADAAGRVVISPVLAGRYRARLRTAFMDSVGMPEITREVEGRENAMIDSIALPTAHDVLFKACPRDSVDNGEGMLRGNVRDEQARAVRHAAVVVTWAANVSIIGGATTDHLRFTEKTIGALTDDDGAWRLCGVPREVLLTVSVVSDSGSDLRKARLNADFAAIDLVAHRAAGGAARELAIATGEASRPRALVELAVFNLQGAPLPDASLEVKPQGGQARTVVTGPSGRALLPDVAPGVLTVKARRIGFKQGELSVSVEAGRNTVPIILSEVGLPTLDTVRVVGGRVLSGLGRNDGFDDRRVRAMGGSFITRANIEAQAPTSTSDLIRRIPGVVLADSAHILIPISARGVKLVDLKPVQCQMRIGVDGMLRENGFDMNSISPNDIHGIEIYSGPATVPPQYNGAKTDSFCGLIMIWTR